MANDFIVQYPAYYEKVTICRMGLPVLTIIDDFNNNEIQAKELFHIPFKKITVFCGHSAHIRERHIEIIQQLKKLSDSDKKQILLIFPFTYNYTNEFLRRINDSMVDSEIDYKIITNFLSEKEVAALRLSCDILISVPSSDQMTAAMLETLYAGGIVITGKWLPYAFLDENKISYLKIDFLEELPDKLSNAIRLLSAGEPALGVERNKEIIKKYFSWESCRKDWLNLFESSLR
jgi:hypothetical protein